MSMFEFPIGPCVCKKSYYALISEFAISKVKTKSDFINLFMCIHLQVDVCLLMLCKHCKLKIKGNL